MSEPVDDNELVGADGLVEQTDNGPEEGQPDPPQGTDWRPWSDGPAGE